MYSLNKLESYSRISALGPVGYCTSHFKRAGCISCRPCVDVHKGEGVRPMWTHVEKSNCVAAAFHLPCHGDPRNWSNSLRNFFKFPRKKLWALLICDLKMPTREPRNCIQVLARKQTEFGYYNVHKIGKLPRTTYYQVCKCCSYIILSAREMRIHMNN